METPICDFVREYAESDPVRMHMPGHKGKPLTGPVADHPAFFLLRLEKKISAGYISYLELKHESLKRSMDMSLLLTNCHLISPDQNFQGSAILIEGGMIRRIYAQGDALPSADEVIDAAGAMTLPGFIDVHCHGKSGVDFCDATDEAMETIGIEDWDRFQRIVEIDKADYETSPDKTDDFMIIEITMFKGRTREQKKELIETVTDKLVETLKIQPTDVFIVIHEPDDENWGLGGKQR